MPCQASRGLGGVPAWREPSVQARNAVLSLAYFRASLGHYRDLHVLCKT
jgi:hypothetical protein